MAVWGFRISMPLTQTSVSSVIAEIFGKHSRTWVFRKVTKVPVASSHVSEIGVLKFVIDVDHRLFHHNFWTALVVAHHFFPPLMFAFAGLLGVVADLLVLACIPLAAFRFPLLTFGLGGEFLVAPVMLGPFFLEVFHFLHNFRVVADLLVLACIPLTALGFPLFTFCLIGKFLVAPIDHSPFPHFVFPVFLLTPNFFVETYLLMGVSIPGTAFSSEH